MRLTALELCAGGGGQALGLETAGFDCAAAVEIEEQFCETLRRNRPKWKVIKKDIKELDPSGFKGVDLVAAGVPCPPFSIAGKQMGRDDEPDLSQPLSAWSKGLSLPLSSSKMSHGFASARFTVYRKELFAKLEDLGYRIWPDVINACNFGVPQLRPRFVLVGLRERFFHLFVPPDHQEKPLTVGQAIKDLMASNYWPGADSWAHRANRIAPTIVGGSEHGGPDLGQLEPNFNGERWE